MDSTSEGQRRVDDGQGKRNPFLYASLGRRWPRSKVSPTDVFQRHPGGFELLPVTVRRKKLDVPQMNRTPIHSRFFPKLLRGGVRRVDSIVDVSELKGGMGRGFVRASMTDRPRPEHDHCRCCHLVVDSPPVPLNLSFESDPVHQQGIFCMWPLYLSTRPTPSV